MDKLNIISYENGFKSVEYDNRQYIGKLDDEIYTNFVVSNVSNPNGYGMRNIMSFYPEDDSLPLVEFIEIDNEMLIFLSINQYGTNERFITNSQV